MSECPHLLSECPHLLSECPYLLLDAHDQKVRQGGIVQDGRRGCRPSTQAQFTPKEAVFLPCDNSNIQSTLGLGSVRPELKNYARRHITAFQSVEDLVNRRKRLQFDISFDLLEGSLSRE
jgi:hypothetical protein